MYNSIGGDDNGVKSPAGNFEDISPKERIDDRFVTFFIIACIFIVGEGLDFSEADWSFGLALAFGVIVLI